MAWIFRIAAAGSFFLTFLPGASVAATVSAAGTTFMYCDGIDSCHPVGTPPIQSSIGAAVYVNGYAGDTLEITTLFPGYINDPEQRYQILHLGPAVGLDSSGAVGQLVSSGAIFHYDVTMVLTDIYGNPVTAPVALYSNLGCNLGGCGWAGAPGIFNNQPNLGNAVAGGARFRFVTSGPADMALRASITGFSFRSAGAFVAFSAPEPSSVTLVASLLLALSFRTRAS